MRVFGEGVRCMPIPITRNIYWAGEDGSIWRSFHVDSRGRFHPDGRMQPCLYGSTANASDRGAYPCVSLTVNGVSCKLAVHRLVAEAWLPDFHWLLEVHHKNGDITDNRPCNLVCLTRAEHQRLHGADVYDADLANCRYDFELHKDDPRPDPFRRAKRRPKRTAAAKAGSARNQIEQLARRAANLQREMEEAGL